MEPIEEENKVISDDDSCPSSNGDSESSGASIDDTIAEGDDVSAELAPDSGITHIPDNLGFPEPDTALDSTFNPVDLGELPCPRDSAPSTSCPADLNHINALPNDELRPEIPCSSMNQVLTENDSSMPDASSSEQPSWTPIVAGLSPDASDVSSETSDLETSLPLEPLEEGNEMISEEESYPSSNGDSIESTNGVDVDLEKPPALIGEVDASEATMDDIAAEIDVVNDDLELNSGIPRLLHAIGFAETIPHSGIDGVFHHSPSDSNLVEGKHPSDTLISVDLAPNSNLSTMNDELDNLTNSREQPHSSSGLSEDGNQNSRTSNSFKG
ncbi:hypothetical protein Dimus_005524 [Dionaea muscipula]